VRTIFFDPTGRRWRWVRLSLVVILIAVVAGIGFAWPRMSAPPALPAGAQQVDIDATDVGPRPPVIGTGPLVRIVQVDRSDGAVVARDPFSGAVLRPLSDAEADDAGRARYVIERYGYSDGAERSIALTFDDGPDPAYTPRLLDLLSAQGVTATFFVTGEMVARHPELIARISREGHAVANHTYSHIDMRSTDDATARRELVATDRIIRASTGKFASYYRPPYVGSDTKSLQEAVNAMLHAQRYGYTVAGFDFDTDDWSYGEGGPGRRTVQMPVPELDGRNVTVLMHDAGGNRAATLAYLQWLIPQAKEAGYRFQTMPEANPELSRLAGPVTPSIWDHATLYVAEAVDSWPSKVVGALFTLAVISVVAGGTVNVGLALMRRSRQRELFATPPDFAGLPVSIVVAAYNEEAVIERTLRSIADSRYPDLEIVVVDDGSTDRTPQIVAELAAADPRIRLLVQSNAGKSAALNRGIAQARGEIIVTLDADTLFTPDTVPNLVRHFAVDDTGTLGAVAGVVKIGNRRNLLTRWQALEYLTQIGVDRAAQDALGAIMIVPGACAAWRKRAIQHAGGYSHSTLAEDCDLSLTLHRLGYRLEQDDEAVCFTEAPETVRALLKQRMRWMFGNLQAIWKHRDMVLRPRYGWLGMGILPYAVASIVLPLVFLPFLYVMAVVTVLGNGAGAVLGYLAFFAAIHLVVAAVAVVLLRERPTHLLMVPLHRLVYEPLRTYLLYKSVFTAVRGTKLGWNKLQRTGTATTGSAASSPEPSAGALVGEAR
jgi:biofilm PGA synthesis N-glycosyltransferase PgaC